jgi:hypothetical protein
MIIVALIVTAYAPLMFAGGVPKNKPAVAVETGGYVLEYRDAYSSEIIYDESRLWYLYASETDTHFSLTYRELNLMEQPENSPVGSEDEFILSCEGDDVHSVRITRNGVVINCDLQVTKFQATLPDGEIEERHFTWYDVTITVRGRVDFYEYPEGYGVIEGGTLYVDLPVFEVAPDQNFDIIGEVHLTF